MEKSHVAQVSDELVKLGCSAEEADHLAREKHRALVDTLKGGRTTAGKIAEQIVEHETAAAGSTTIADVAEVNSANVGAKPAADEFEFERTPPASLRP